MKEKNFNNCKHDLNTHDIKELVSIIGYRCPSKTKKILESKLIYSSNKIPHYSILDRLIYENFKWVYIAGQSYHDEIRTIRRIILTGE